MLLCAAELRLVRLREDDVEGAGAYEGFDRTGEDGLRLVDRPGVERVPGRAIVREPGGELGGDRVRKGLERNPRRLSMIRQ